MIKTRSFKLKLSHHDFKLVQNHSIESAKCWNDIIKIAKDYYDINKKWISKFDIQPLIKGQYELHSETVQGLTDIFNANRQTIAQLRRNGDKKAKYPYKEKHFFMIPFKTHVIKQTETNLRLTLHSKCYLNISISNLPKIRTTQLVWNNGYYLFYTFDELVIDTYGTKTCGIDLGEVHSIAMTTEEGNSLIISNRLGRSIKRYRNKKLGSFSEAIHRCTKYSRKWRKLVNSKNEMKIKTKNQLRNLYHQTTRKAIDFAVSNNIGEIVCGNPKGVGKNTKKNKTNSSKNRQKLSQAEFGTLKQYLKYKAESKGIIFSLVNESYTSQTCPACSTRKKPTGRNYSCECGFKAHRDIVGAFNILRKKYQCELVDFVMSYRHPIKVSYY